MVTIRYVRFHNATPKWQIIMMENSVVLKRAHKTYSREKDKEQMSKKKIYEIEEHFGL